MSVKHVGLVLECFTAKPALKLVAIILADHADADGVCWPSYRRIAQQGNMSERNVARHVRELVELGIVTKLRTGTIVKQGDKSIRISNAYRMNAHVLEARKSTKLSTGDLGINVDSVYLEHDKNDTSRWTPVSTKPSVNQKSNHKRRRPVDNSKTDAMSLGEILSTLEKMESNNDD